MRSFPLRSGWRRPPPDAAPPGCIALGGGRSEALGVGAKASRLDQAARSGLAVPSGFVVPDGEAPPDLADWRGGGDIRSFAVRSAFSAEDGSDESLAGWFDTDLRVTREQVARSVERVRSSAENRPGRFRRDVLVMAMIDAQHAGVVFSEAGTYDDLVNVTTGTAERLVAGEESGERRLLPRLERASQPGWPRRLQGLLRRVRQVFGDEAWDVEWADDGTTCWLIQIRPVTRPARRNEAFTIANHAEILPTLPSHLMTSVIDGSGPELFAWYRRFDPQLPADRPFLEVVAGRPFINLTLLEDLLRHLGLPTALVAGSIGGPPEHDRPIRPARMVRKLPVLVRMGLAQIVAVVWARANERNVAAAGVPPAASFAAAIDQLSRAHVALVTGMFPLSSAIGPPVALLRRAGTLAEHAARHRTVTAELAAELDVLVTGGDDPADRQAFLARFGHRGVYESDIARPRYRDEPDLLVTCGTRSGSSPAPVSRRRRTVRGILTTPIWWLAWPPLAARERLRDRAMIGFAAIRDSLVRIAKDAVRRGQLPTVDHLWQLDADEVRRLDDGWRPDASFWSGRAAERERLAAIDPPPVVHRFDDPSEWRHDVPQGDRLTGLSLTDGVVRGRAWVLDEPSVDPPAGFLPETTVLVARSVDAGWIGTFAQAAAVVVETGGDLSHGSILLRERGVPAVTNVRGVTRVIRTGDEVEVRAGAGAVERFAADVGRDRLGRLPTTA